MLCILEAMIAYIIRPSKRVKQVGQIVAKGHCKVCGARHAKDRPHDPAAPFYIMRFAMAHKRKVTWADAVAHCPPFVVRHCKQVLTELEEWTEPPEGVEPIAEYP